MKFGGFFGALTPSFGNQNV